ncbi:MAG: heavy-metal-associated domain-containing protein [Firmicutes bacterium]|nr:heavy-metal-associated domain-containing protein [Bacillota bacterium]
MKRVFLLDGLCCANCAAKIERGIAKLDGVESASVSFLTTKLTIVFDEEKEDKIIEEAMKIVKKIEPDVEVEEY